MNIKNNEEKHRLKGIEKAKKEWGKVKFNPRTAIAESATPWQEFKASMNDNEREERSANAVNMASAEAQACLKKREQNYRRSVMDTKRKVKPKWEDFTEAANEEDNNVKKEIKKFNEKQSSTELSNYNNRVSDRSFNDNQNKFGNKRRFKGNQKKFNNRKSVDNESVGQYQEKGINPFRMRTANKTGDSSNKWHPKKHITQFEMLKIDKDNLDTKARNFFRAKITKATCIASGLNLDQAIEDMKRYGVVRKPNSRTKTKN